MEVFLSDNAGHRVPPAGAPDPVAASGQTLTQGTAGTDTEATVVAGATYAFTAQKTGGFMFGVATMATAANILWCAALYQTVTIVIPAGITTLHYTTDTNSGVGYLRKLSA